MNSDSLKKLKLPLRLRLPLDLTIGDTGSLVVRRDLSEYQGNEGALYLGGMNVAEAVLRHHAGKDVYYIEIVAPRENVDDDRLLASTVRLELVFGIAEQPENMPLELAHGATVPLRPLYPIKEIMKNDAAGVAEHESSSEPAPDPSEPTESSAKKGPMSMEEIDDLLAAISKGDAGASPSSAHAGVALSLDGLIVAKGETVLVDDRFGIRIIEAVEGDDRFALMERPDAGLIRGVAVLASRSIALADLPDLTEGSVITMDATALGPSVLRFDNGIVHAGEILFGDAHDAGWAFRRLYSLEEITRSLMQDRMRAAAFASDDGEGDIADGATDVDEVAVFIDSPMDAAGATMGNEDMSAEDANARRWAALEAAEAEMTDEHESTPEELFPDEIRQQLLEHAQSIDFMDAPSFTKENLLTLSRIIKNMCLSMGSAIDDLLSLERSVHLRLKRARVAPFSEFHVDDGLDSMPWSIELDPNLGFVFVKPGRGPLVSPEGVDKVLELMGETSADSSSNISIETWVHMYLTLTICDQLIRAFEPLVAIQTRTQSFDENAETGAGFVSPVTAVPADARSALFEIAIENGDVRNAITLAMPLAGLAPIVPILEKEYLDGTMEVPGEIRSLFAGRDDDVADEQDPSECDTYPEDMPWERRLPIACYLMDHAAVREFLDQGGDPNIQDEDGETPLETLAANWFDADPGVELTRVKEMHGIRMERIVGPDDARECAYLLLDAGARVTKLAGERAKEGSSIDGAPKRELIRLLRECLIARKDGTPFERWWEIPARTDSREASETKVMSEDQIDDLLASISSESTGPFAHAEELFAEGEYLEAIDAYLQAMKEAGENAAAHNNIGLSYLNLGEYEKALKYFKKSLQVDPDYATALANQACAYKRMGDIDRAIAVSTEALARGETGDILYNLACYTAINGDAKTAMAYLKRAIDHDERFREMAADDDDFAALEDSKDFRKLVG
ncbi:MAG TPA: tetratricopeptide repeat protein [Spirochaetota bacterium]|nr:tetratricopeptide repeat protein [Spirochaetota bacterium]HNT11015.1 tetratricopeptide repeat protein [Spirochaetota bacterium]